MSYRTYALMCLLKKAEDPDVLMEAVKTLELLPSFWNPTDGPHVRPTTLSSKLPLHKCTIYELPEDAFSLETIQLFNAYELGFLISLFGLSADAVASNKSEMARIGRLARTTIKRFKKAMKVQERERGSDKASDTDPVENDTQASETDHNEVDKPMAGSPELEADSARSSMRPRPTAEVFVLIPKHSQSSSRRPSVATNKDSDAQASPVPDPKPPRPKARPRFVVKPADPDADLAEVANPPPKRKVGDRDAGEGEGAVVEDEDEDEADEELRPAGKHLSSSPYCVLSSPASIVTGRRRGRSGNAGASGKRVLPERAGPSKPKVSQTVAAKEKVGPPKKKAKKTHGEAAKVSEQPPVKRGGSGKTRAATAARDGEGHEEE